MRTRKELFNTLLVELNEMGLPVCLPLWMKCTGLPSFWNWIR